MHGISLIIPIYNVEDYIKTCLLSVIKSMKDFQNVQVILVDDGSLDSSGEIAKEIAQHQQNFLFFRKENGGLSDARNFGMEYAKYDYLAFLDSDDWIDERYFTLLLEQIETNPDLVLFDALLIDGKTDTEILPGIDLQESLWTIQSSASFKLYHKKLFDELKFAEGKIYEDVGMTYKLLYYVQKFKYVKEPLYYYRTNREGSIINTTSPKINDIYEVLDDVYRFYVNQVALTKENLDGLCYQYVKLLLWSNMYRQLKYFRFNFWGFYKKMRSTRKLIYQQFPNWRDNHFLKKSTLYFESRFGRNFIKKLNLIGKNQLSTIAVLVLLVQKNKYRM